MSYLSIGQRTFLELITELEDILETDRYDVPSIVKTDLKAAKIILSAADDSFINEMLNTLALFLIPLEDKIHREDVEFFKRLEVCKACARGDGNKGQDKGQDKEGNKEKGECVCVAKCGKKCKCSANCINCSQILKDLDSKTFNAIKYIVDQAVDGGEEELDDINVIFKFIKSIYALVQTHKRR